ncbi:2OG-Fe dioxygenase family protein [Ramlibacter ginsenosidimutans]|uniref:2OG-Fe dioxygenase family protein n=1 Tax=Ramlibacter ginsenosidimutans TaxID=502333 RepID=A0A934TX54_9BURK|nr:2OG-Fe dioxygenase family protein [Ramlibacter ginsenosidimutans]MBK6008906.1 2OG-Fe dioxygenase family protein [Ramlibacter ginsenosidimutans]
MLLRPTTTDPDQLTATLRERGYAVLDAQGVCTLAGCTLAQLQELLPSWDDLPPDEYLKDGGRYRRRRHSCFVAEAGALTQAPHRAHWQPLEYNALHGGMQRWFAPMEPQVVAQPAWTRLLQSMGDVATAVKGPQPWYIEAHQFRIDTEGGIGRPTPEGAHRDGVDLVAVFLLARENIKGGETRVFQADGPAGERFTLTEPWSVLLLDDARVIHETTPIQPVDGPGHRDTLVLTLRAGGFQGG